MTFAKPNYMKHLVLFALLNIFCFLHPKAQTATFEITANTSTPELDAAMAYAAGIWSNYLVSEVPIKVNVFFTPFNPGFLGLTVPNGRKDFVGAPEPGYWYPSCLANALSGEELNVGEADMDILLPNIGVVNWYLGTDGNPAANQYDFVSVFLHEIGHGLGILSLANVESNLGSFGMISQDQFAPYVPSFPFPDQEGLPGIYDTYLVTGTGGVVINDFPNSSTDLAGVFTSGAVFFNGPRAMAANAGSLVEIHAPGLFSFGSSITHIDEGTYGPGSGNSLMTPNISEGEVEHEPGPIVIGMLEDIGWNPMSSLAPSAFKDPLKWYAYPQGASIGVFIQNAMGNSLNIQLLDFTGRVLDNQEVRQEGAQELWLGQQLPAGQYIIRIYSQRQQWSKKVFWAPN